MAFGINTWHLLAFGYGVWTLGILFLLWGTSTPTKVKGGLLSVGMLGVMSGLGASIAFDALAGLRQIEKPLAMLAFAGLALLGVQMYSFAGKLTRQAGGDRRL